MSHKQHLQVLNERHSLGNRSGNSFFLFPSLPPEVRCMIWRTSIKRERIIRLSIGAPSNLTAAFSNQVFQMYGGRNESFIPPKSNSGIFGDVSTSDKTSYKLSHIQDQFRVIVQVRNVLSKLLRVNREARSESMAFYRARIPCSFTRDTLVNQMEPTSFLDTLPFNPEYDFLFIKFRSHPYLVTCAAFLLHIKASLDPHHIGARNLALDYTDLSGSMLEPWEICTQSEREMVTQTFRELSEVFFITETSCRMGRQIFPFFSHGALASKLIFNRSTPILSETPAFSRLLHDPRPIQKDLRYVYTSGAHPETALRLWLELLEVLDATGGRTLYSWLLAYTPSSYVKRIYSMNNAQIFIQREDDAWNGRVQGPSISDEVDRAIAAGRANPDIRTEGLDQVAPPAFGYWLFPLRSDGNQLYTNQGGGDHVMKLQDLSSFSPSLVLTDLF